MEIEDVVVPSSVIWRDVGMLKLGRAVFVLSWWMEKFGAWLGAAKRCRH